MNKNHPYRLLSRWQRKVHFIAFVSMVISVLVLTVLHYFLNIRPVTLFIILAFFILVGTWVWKRSIPLLDQIFPVMDGQSKTTEYSSRLLVADEEQLPFLQRLQKERIIKKLDQSAFYLPFPKVMVVHFVILLFVSSLGLIFWTHQDNSPSTISTSESDPEFQEDVIHDSSDTTYLASSTITVYPPEYTGRSSFTSAESRVSVPEGAKITWNAKVSGPAKGVYVIVNGEDTLKMNSNYSLTMQLEENIFYQYLMVTAMQNIITPYRYITIIEDKKPLIQIDDIKEYTRLPFAENHNIKFNISIEDEYGIKEAYISATVAKGKGESVKFREKKYPLDQFNPGAKNYGGRFTFSTQALEMEPGNELYFYVAADDYCSFESHLTKSQTYFIILEDTSSYVFMDDAGMQVELMPDFFRSQRQIIIDTEELIAERKNVDQHHFQEESNALGYDQKMLRLKYGQFLGEEAESGIAMENEIETEDGEEHDHDHDHNEEEFGQSGSRNLDWGREVLEKFGHDHDHQDEPNQRLENSGPLSEEDPTRPSWVQELTHSHDNIEEATFFDMSIKSKLRAAMTEMWDAELYLRLFEPEKSLPYQYKALKYLEEIKNHARIYVHRIGFDPPAIKESEKRLSGDLDEIISPNRSTTVPKNEPFGEIIASISVIREIVNEGRLKCKDEEVVTIQAGASSLAYIGIERPEVLPILTAIQQLGINGRVSQSTQLDLILKGLLSIIPQEKDEIVPSAFYTHPINQAAIQALNSSR